MQEEQEAEDIEFQKKLKSELELGDLIKKQEKGRISTEEEKDLDRRLGNFYTVRCCGQVHKINHCIVARALIGAFILFMSFSMIYIASTEIQKGKG